jgi:hypothetical protein
MTPPFGRLRNEFLRIHPFVSYFDAPVILHGSIDMARSGSIISFRKSALPSQQNCCGPERAGACRFRIAKTGEKG